MRGWLRRPDLGGLDWWLVLLVAGFLLASPWWLLGPELLHAAGLGPAPERNRYYRTAVQRSALRTPNDNHKLRVLEGERVTLVRLTPRPLAPGSQTLLRDIWVSHPEDLLRFCAGSRKPLLKLQQALGLPARRGDYRLYRISVSTTNVVRPCLGGDGPSADRCSLEAPAALLAPLPENPEDRAIHAAQVAEALQRIRLAATNVLSAWQTGTRDEWARPGEYPYKGVPFTGMGWTWNWDPQAKSTMGVTEFIIPAGTKVTVDEGQTPGGFCGSRL